MVVLHSLLGAAVVLVNGAAGVVGLFGSKSSSERFEGLATGGLGLLIVQLVLGFLLITNTTIEPVHMILPVAAVAAVALARQARGGARVRMMALAGFAAALLSLATFLLAI